MFALRESPGHRAHGRRCDETVIRFMGLRIGGEIHHDEGACDDQNGLFNCFRHCCSFSLRFTLRTSRLRRRQILILKCSLAHD